MRKGIVMLLLAAMTTAALAGCGGPSGQNEQKQGKAKEAGETQETQLTVAWWGNQLRNEKTQEMLELYSKENPGITFDGQFSEWDDYWKKLATASAGNALPDIIQMDYKYIQQYVENGLLVDLQPYVDDKTLNLDDCTETAVAAGKVKDGLYGLCSGTASPALFYNKSVTDELGIEVKDNMTMDEFESICKEIYDKKGMKTNINYGNNEQFIEYMLRAQDIVMYESDKLGGDSAQPYIDFFQVYEDGIKEGWHVSPEIFTERTIGSVEQDPMVYGSSPEAMSWCAFQYSSMYAAIKNAAPDDMEIGISTWPSDDAEKSDYLKPSMFWAVSKDCKNPEEAVKFIDFYTNSLECNKINSAERGVPISTKVVEELKPELDETTQTYMDFVQNVVTPASSAINPPLPATVAEVNDMLNKLEEQVCYGQLSAKEAGEQLYEQGNKIMQGK